jgi:hypothetical protein
MRLFSGAKHPPGLIKTAQAQDGAGVLVRDLIHRAGIHGSDARRHHMLWTWPHALDVATPHATRCQPVLQFGPTVE